MTDEAALASLSSGAQLQSSSSVIVRRRAEENPDWVQLVRRRVLLPVSVELGWRRTGGSRAP